VTHGSSRRRVTLTHSQALFLKALAENETTTTARKTKHDLLKLVPELRIHIERRPRDPDADLTNEACYGLPLPVRQKIDMGKL